MSYVDLAIGIGMFLLFFALVISLSINYLIRTPQTALVITELREKATQLFDQFFSSEGTPADWEETSSAPSELGLITTIQRIPITVEEENVSDRVNEPVTVLLIFDEDCANKVWNNTVRVYDENFDEIEYELAEDVFCTSQFLNMMPPIQATA